ncbi:MAG: universal stress protein [Solirubrobacteraceae bacterium]
MAGQVVIGYDGSSDAQRAIDVAARAVRAESAIVVTAWHLPIAATTTPLPPLGAPTATSLEEEREFEQRGRQTAEEGASRARAAGLDAEPSLQRATGTTDIARTLFDVAEERDADLVVVGRRGMSRIEAVVLGSVSDAAVRDGRRPVLVVPGGEG